MCLFAAFILYSLGIRKVELGQGFLAFINNCNNELNNFTIAIPNIPHIPTLTGSFFLPIDFLNGIIDFLNFPIVLFNTAISIIQFLIIMLKNFIILIKEGYSVPTPFPYL